MIFTKNNRGKSNSKYIIYEKMRCLSDFDICDRWDDKMIKRLEDVINNNPDKDPRTVLDYYCRPIIQEKVNSW